MIKWNLEKMNTEIEDEKDLAKIVDGTTKTIELLLKYVEKYLNETLLKLYKKVETKEKLNFSTKHEFNEIKLVMKSELKITGVIHIKESEVGLDLAEMTLKSEGAEEKIEIGLILHNTPIQSELGKISEGARTLGNWLVSLKLNNNEELLKDVVLKYNGKIYSCSYKSYPYEEIDNLLELIFAEV